MNFKSSVKNNLIDHLRGRMRATSAVDAYIAQREMSLMCAHASQTKRLEREHQVAIDRGEFTFSHELGWIDRALDETLSGIRVIEPVSIDAFPVEASTPPGGGSPFVKSPEFAMMFTGSNYLSSS